MFYDKCYYWTWQELNGVKFVETIYVVFFLWLKRNFKSGFDREDVLATLLMATIIFMNLLSIHSFCNLSRRFVDGSFLVVILLEVFFFFHLVRNHNEIYMRRKDNLRPNYQLILVTYVVLSIVFFFLS